MSQTIFQQVAEAIATAIDGVEAGSTYTHTLTAIRPKRLNLAGDETGDGAAIVSITNVVEVVDEAATNNDQLWHLDVKVEISAVESDSSTEPIEDRLSQMAADAWLALSATVSGGSALGGLADGINLREVDFMIDNKGPYASCSFEVLVWTAFGDLYTGAS